MRDKKLSLEIVTPGGVTMEESDVDGVVVRRREAGALGSEIAVLPLHGPMLVRVAPCTMRIYRGGETRLQQIDGGFMEVRGDKVTLVTTKMLS